MSSSSAVRLFAPSSRGRGELSPEMRLSEFFADYYDPVVLLARDARPRNLEAIRESLVLWIAATGDPPLKSIDAWVCRDFVVRLKERPGRSGPLSPNTVRKHCGAIQAMFDLVGPAGPRRREAVGLLPTAPYLQRPRKQEKPAEDCFTVEELEQLLAAADAARLPARLACSPGDYFRRLMLVIFNTGMRVGSLRLARWEHFRGDALLLPAHVVKGSRGQRIELNDAARAALEAMRGCGQPGGADDAHPFPWPAWPQSRGQLYKEFSRIRECLPADRRFAFHAIRKLTNNELARINPLACMKVLGHSTGRTTVEHYTSRTVARDAVAQLPPLRLRRDRQRALFD